jgi:hypothetical protein
VDPAAQLCRVLVVTNNYHMPRSLMELSQASPEVTFVAYPVTHADLKTEAWLADPVALRTLFTWNTPSIPSPGCATGAEQKPRVACAPMQGEAAGGSQLN